MSRRLVALALIGATATTPLAAVWLHWGWYLDGPVTLLLAVAGGYAAGAWLPRWVALVGVLSATGALVVANQAYDDSYSWLNDAMFFLVIVGGAAAAGAAVTRRTLQVRRLEQLEVELDEQHRVEAAAARLDEQNRIHHEVHSRLAERIAGIATRAEGARRAGDDGALHVIESEARATLDQLRALLGAMRAQPSEAQTPEAQCTEAQRTEIVPAPSVERRPPPTAGDLALAAAIGGALAVETSVAAYSNGSELANVAASLLTAAPLAFRRGWPISSGAASLAAGSAMSLWLTPIPSTVTGLALLAVIFYSIGAWAGRWRWVVGWVLAAAGSITMSVLAGTAQENGLGVDVWIVLMWSIGAITLGRIAAGWLARVRRTSAVVDGLRRGRDAALQLATAREREAIAGELHDTVAHAMTVVCLHAAAGRRSGGDHDKVLHTITATATASLAELRHGIRAFESDEHPMDPRRISETARQMGVSVEFTGAEVRGVAAVLGYRVVREAIVNISRHAAGAKAVVSALPGDGVVTIEITDSGGTSTAAGDGTGTGLSGLARAVEAQGGTMSWGVCPDGGHRVSAVIPEDPT